MTKDLAPASVRARSAGCARLLLAAACMTLALAPPARASDPIATEIRRIIERVEREHSIDLGGATVVRSADLIELYRRRGYAPLWHSEAVAEALHRAVLLAAQEGLRPEHYHASHIRAQRLVVPAAEHMARLDVLRSDALLALMHDLQYGRVDPAALEATWEVPRARRRHDAASLAVAIVESNRMTDGLRALRPDHFVHRGLVDALSALRAIERRGGWPHLPAGPSLRAGDVDARVPRLRHRLETAGYSVGTVAAGEELLFDAPLDHAVRSFQHRHGLNEDGVVGPITLAELNVPVSRRIDQIRINLERVRWVTHDLADTFVAVNVAGARAYLVRRGVVMFETRVIVGQPYTRTPVFTAAMRHIELNPTWTVPPGIVGEVLGEIRRDASYLRRQNMRVLDRSGRRIDPTSIDFARYTARSFPYVFRQDPGPRNPLGAVKFVFPNEHHVYLHDTPARGLFEQERRMFSHGCIRVERPLELATLLLESDGRWDRAALDAAVATGGTRVIPLPAPVPVLILYWTASADLHGELHFYRDVYGRDDEVLRALDAPVRGARGTDAGPAMLVDDVQPG